MRGIDLTWAKLETAILWRTRLPGGQVVIRGR